MKEDRPESELCMDEGNEEVEEKAEKLAKESKKKKKRWLKNLQLKL